MFGVVALLWLAPFVFPWIEERRAEIEGQVYEAARSEPSTAVTRNSQGAWQRILDRQQDPWRVWIDSP
jgi:hypothetical protein